MRAATTGQLVPADGHDLDAALPQLEVVRAAVLSVPGALPEASRFRFVFYDPVLTSRLLQLDGARAIRSGPFTLDALVAAIGEDPLRSLVWGAAESAALGYLGGVPLWQTSGYWLHSLASANVAWSIAELVGYPTPDEAYLAGLLQDVGMLALTLRPPLVEGTTPFEEDHVAADERSLYGLGHPEVGARLAESWGLSPTLADALLLHHAPVEELRGAHLLLRIAKAAESLADGAPPIDEPIGLLASLLGVDGAALADQAAAGIRRADAVAVELGINAERLRQRPRGAPRGPADTRPPRGAGGRSGVPAWASAQGPEDLVAAVTQRARWQRLALLAAAGNDLDDALVRVAAGLHATFPWSRCAYFRAAPARDAFIGELIGAAPAAQADLAVPVTHESSVVARVARSRRPAAASVKAGSPVAALDRQLARRLHADLLACVPVLAGARVDGMIVVGAPEAMAGEMETLLEGLVPVAAALSAGAGAGAAPATVAGARAGPRRDLRGLVHEARNPLAVMRNYLELLAERMPQPDAGAHEIAVLKQELDRVNGLLDVMAGQVPQEAARPTDLHQLLDELVLAYGKVLFDSRGVTLSVALDPEVRLASPHANALRQIVLNLLKNASEALAPGGRVELATSVVFSEPGRRLVEVAVADDGPGISAQVLERLGADEDREPVTGRGHGLRNSLALARRIGAQLQLRRRTGGGTLATLLLPVHGAAHGTAA